MAGSFENFLRNWAYIEDAWLSGAVYSIRESGWQRHMGRRATRVFFGIFSLDSSIKLGYNPTQLL